ncbi:MAG: LysE family translocator [Rhodobacteraceae bacterium]|nr:LysE family translocator [Paracoccaceae bacterium]
MPLDLWLAFVATSALLLIIPGPTVVLVLSYALSRGRCVAAATALGVAAGHLLAMSLSVLGLGAVILASAKLFTLAKWTGAAYLVWLGWRMLRHAPGGLIMYPLPGEAQTGAPRSTAPFVHAAAVTALNPKSIGFFLALVPQFLDTEIPSAPQVAVLIATFVGLAALNALAYALLADRLRTRFARPRVVRWLSRSGGAVLIGLGVMTATMKRAA